MSNACSLVVSTTGTGRCRSWRPSQRWVARGCRLYFVRSPNPESTPQRALAEVETWCRDHPGWWGDRVQLTDWVPHARRFDLLRDVDLAVVTHSAGLETDLAMRTRLIEALAAGCPVVTTPGGTTSRLVEEWNAGWVALRTDPESIASCLAEALDDPAAAIAARPAGPGASRRAPSLGPRTRATDPVLPATPAGPDAFRLFLSSRNGLSSGPAGLSRETLATSPDFLFAPSSVTMSGVSVVIASWNGLEQLRECLPAVRDQADPGCEWEVLVLDNGSSDGTGEWLRRLHPSVRLIVRSRNVGFSAGNNLLAKEARFDSLALLNNDARPEPEWLRELVRAIDAAPREVAAVSGLIVDWDAERLDFGRGVMTFDGPCIPTRPRSAARQGPDAVTGHGAAVRLWRQHVDQARAVPRARRVRRGLLRVHGGRRSGMAAVVERAPRAVRPGSAGSPPLDGDQRSTGRLQPWAALRAQRVLHGLQELRGRPLGEADAGSSPHPELAHRNDADREQLGWGQTQLRPVRWGILRRGRGCRAGAEAAVLGDAL